MANDPSVARWTYVPHPYGLPEGRAFLRKAFAARRKNEARSFLIVRASDGLPVGMVGLRDIHPRDRRANLGYFVARPHRGKGYATEAVEQAVRLAFGKLRLHRIEAGVFVGNRASARVLRKNGFRREGVKRKVSFRGGRWLDETWYARLASGADERP